MADYYTQGSYLLNLKRRDIETNPEWWVWWKDVRLTGTPVGEVPVEVLARHPNAVPARPEGSMGDEDSVFDPVGLVSDFDELEYVGGRFVVQEDGIWFHDSTNFDTNLIVQLVEGFLRRFQLDWVEEIRFAYTCNKPRTDGFGGGYIFITRHNEANTHEYDNEIRLDAIHGTSRIHREDMPGQHFKTAPAVMVNQDGPIVVRHRVRNPDGRTYTESTVSFLPDGTYVATCAVHDFSAVFGAVRDNA